MGIGGCLLMGIGVHLSKVKGVDKKPFKKGVAVDAENQLIVVAFKEGAEADMATVTKAIDKAGYEAAHYYQWVDGTVQQSSFDQE